MYTYIVKTSAPKGPRSVIRETFVVVQASEEHARAQAIAAAHPGASVTKVEQVTTVSRVMVGY